ncbi:LOW QUALITY PROTEIN: hypothetical protein Smp_154050 [Schistosoma mansoni]|uniref:hypothetical protein n=1 Tax=Schistosoma mansoni TaxID=6183 RepID=UPI00022C8338|nr:LOW QUALITY PROTEIN: hypothetical protein Smp_154050 [Schistosoma mansoni]|eukprot:XP_018644274.1 LOW QUALITY PROTEIN: hypothetical protein Smp_154050 [Schistosoma mansoni]
MAESHSNGKSEPSSPYKKTMDRPLSGIALFGPSNLVFTCNPKRYTFPLRNHFSVNFLSRKCS